MPVGRIEYLHLGPLSFEEFLRAREEHYLLDQVASFEMGRSFSADAHQSLLSLQREFLYVGGLPEAVAVHTEGGHVQDVADVHRSLASTYGDDFGKYGTRAALPRIQRIFRYIPGAVGQKVKYTNIDPSAQSRDLRAAIDLLSMARVVWKLHSSDCSGLPLHAQISPNVYKCLFLDVGLMNHIVGVDWSQLSLWDSEGLVHEGSRAEQFIGQHLLFRKKGLELPSLSYWLREGKRNNAEVDYVIAHKMRMIPIEVKAGKSGTLRSLHQFIAKKLASQEERLAVRFDANPPSLQDVQHRLPGESGVASYRLLSLPLYMVGQTERMVDSLPASL